MCEDTVSLSTLFAVKIWNFNVNVSEINRIAHGCLKFILSVEP